MYIVRHRSVFYEAKICVTEDFFLGLITSKRDAFGLIRIRKMILFSCGWWQFVICAKRKRYAFVYCIYSEKRFMLESLCWGKKTHTRKSKTFRTPGTCVCTASYFVRNFSLPFPGKTLLSPRVRRPSVRFLLRSLVGSDYWPFYVQKKKKKKNSQEKGWFFTLR